MMLGLIFPNSPTKYLMRVVVPGLALAAVAGCGNSDGSGDGFVDVDDGHAEISVGSTEEGGGNLAVGFDFSMEIAIRPNQCLGGVGADCSGGIQLFSTSAVGFAPVEADDAPAGLFALDEGTPVTLELTRRASEASLFVNSVALDSIGESVLLGVANEGLHAHGEWLVAVPGGSAVDDDFLLGFKLTSQAPQYADSEEFTMVLHATEGDSDHEHGAEHDEAE